MAKNNDDEYWQWDEDAQSSRQLKPLPTTWLDLSRFKPGDEVRMLESQRISVGERESRDLKGEIGVVLEVRNGTARGYPSRLIDYEGEPLWTSQSAGWLVVRFPFDCYGVDAEGNVKPRACRAEDEGSRWEKVSSPKRSRKART